MYQCYCVKGSLLSMKIGIVTFFSSSEHSKQQTTLRAVLPEYKVLIQPNASKYLKTLKKEHCAFGLLGKDFL